MWRIMPWTESMSPLILITLAVYCLFHPHNLCVLIIATKTVPSSSVIFVYILHVHVCVMWSVFWITSMHVHMLLVSVNWLPCMVFSMSWNFVWTRLAMIISCMLAANSYPTCMRRGKVIGFVCLSIVTTKITRSQHLGTWSIHKYNESVEVGEKLASVCLKWSGTAYKHHE